MNIEKSHSLRVTGLVKTFIQGGKEIQVLRGLNALFEQGRSYAITGVSGSGKSTFLQILGGLDIPSAGTVFFNDQSLDSIVNKSNFLNKNLGFVFQFHYLLKELSVIENVMLPGLIGGCSKQDAYNRALYLLDLVGVVHRSAVFPMKLSGGELQRVSIARALFNRPTFLIADEPTGSLDKTNAEFIVSLFLRFQQEWGMGIIICTHDDAVYNRMQSIFHLDQGLLEIVKD